MAKRLFVAYLWPNCTSPLSLSGSAVVETSFGESVVAGNLGSAAGGAATVKGEMSEMLMISSVWSNYSPNAWKAGTRKRPYRGEGEK